MNRKNWSWYRFFMWIPAVVQVAVLTMLAAMLVAFNAQAGYTAPMWFIGFADLSIDAYSIAFLYLYVTSIFGLNPLTLKLVQPT